MHIIDSFRGPYRWLSNFYKCPTMVDDITYPTVEHAFQAAKTDNIDEKMRIAATTNPVVAKRMGKKVKLRADWDAVKLDVMRELIDLKFQDDTLAHKLIATGNAELIEGNHWHDNFWGACICNRCNGTDENHLGRLLMQKREELKQGS